MRQLNFNVDGPHGDDIPYLVTDNPVGAPARVPGVFESASRLIITCPPFSEITGGATVFYQQGQRSFRVILPPEADGAYEAGDPTNICFPPEYGSDSSKVWLHYKPLYTRLPALSVDGQFLRGGGQRMTVLESSEFPAYVRWLQGDDLTPTMLQRQALGYNFFRTWLLNTSVYRIVPSDHGQAFYDRLPEFVQWCSQFGIYNEFTMFTQAQSLMPGRSNQQRHVDLIASALMGVRDQVLLSLVNEADQYDNRTDDGIVLPADSFITSRGSNGSDAWAPKPISRYAEYHSNGAAEWWRRAGHNSMEIADVEHVPCVAGENTRIPDQDDSVAHLMDAAEAAALLCMGFCTHSVNGKRSMPWSGRELEQATAAGIGSRKVPLEFQAGRYSRESNPPGALRVYRRTLNDGRFHEAIVRE